MKTTILVIALLAAAIAPRSAHADDTPIIDAAVEGGGAGVATAYFFGGGYYVVYSWGSDRAVGGPRGLATLPFAAPFATGANPHVDAGSAGLAGPPGEGTLVLGNQRIRYDSRTNAVDANASGPLSGLTPDFDSGFDSMIDGLGSFANFIYAFKGDQYIKFSRPTRAVTGPKSTVAGFHLPAGFASRIDAAVNGAGNFVGKGYFFHGDQYVRYSWTADAPEGQPQTIAPKWPGLVELVLAGRAAGDGLGQVTTAIARLEAYQAGTADQPTRLLVEAALQQHFLITSAAARTANLPAIIARLRSVTGFLADPNDRIRFRTDAEAKADGASGRTLYTARANRQTSITSRFPSLVAGCRSVEISNRMFIASGIDPLPADPTTTELALTDSASFNRLARHIGLGSFSRPCDADGFGAGAGVGAGSSASTDLAADRR